MHVSAFASPQLAVKNPGEASLGPGETKPRPFSPVSMSSYFGSGSGVETGLVDERPTPSGIVAADAAIVLVQEVDGKRRGAGIEFQVC